jgi:hypothetical protein
MADESADEVHARQPISGQTLEDDAHGLQLVGIFLSHPIPPAGLDGGAATSNHNERCSGIIPQEEPPFLKSNQRVRDREVEVWVNSWSGMDIDFCAAPHRCYHVQVQT